MLTDEQKAIIESRARRIRVLAFAGTGKTSTLVGYARARNERFLYLAYNKALQKEAVSKFPTNVKCSTVHALAFGQIGKKYAHKLGNMRVGDVADTLRLSYKQAAMVLATVNSYLCSADDEMGKQHLPPEANQNNAMETYAVVAGAQALWRDMQDFDNVKVPQSHDGYLKLYALSRPILPADCVLFDEAQDANPVIRQLALGHPGPIVMTGDKNQAIYAWRGARDAMDELRDAETYALTQSFRFGKGIADVANQLLGYLGETRTLIGAGQYPESRMTIDRDRPFAVVARTNMSLIMAAIETIPLKLRSHYVGGVENIRLNLIADGYHLYCNSRSNIQDRFIQKYGSFSALADYASQARDMEMGLLVRIIGTFTHRIPDLLRDIRALAVDDIHQAQRVFSTAHRSKGLEFLQVLLTDDYTELVDSNKVIPLSKLDRQDVNLHYVAATRAIESLQVSDQLRAFLRANANVPLAVVPA